MRRTRGPLLGLYVVMLCSPVGCGGSAGDDTPDDGAAGSSDAAPDAGDDGTEVVLTSADGTRIVGTFTHPDGETVRPSVLLVHGFASSRQSWVEVGLTEVLTEQGYATLAIDVRAHGDSGPAQGSFLDVLDDPDQAPEDVRAAVDHLRGHDLVDASRIGVVGSSMGANLAVVASTLDYGVAAVVPLSPKLDKIEQLAGNPATIEPGPMLCIAAAGDGDGIRAEACETLVASADEPKELLLYPDGDEHGLDVLRTYPDAEPAIVDYLGRAL